ncbi:MAG: pyruvate flavodoxin/ferredoxin oxidoreductase, partial [Desulfobacterales bacterium]
MGLSFIEGNEAVAYGAVTAGCRFFAGYPITPATTIFNTMLKLLPPMGGICLQG